MKMRIVFLCILVIVLLTGCAESGSAKDIRPHMITQINVTCQSCEETVQRHYVNSDKIRIFLLALRKLGPDFPAEIDAEALRGKTICIRMTCTDDSVITYLIKDNQYLQKNGGAWRQINPDQFSGFWQMILQMASDEQLKMRWDPFSPASDHRVYFPALRRIVGK